MQTKEKKGNKFLNRRNFLKLGLLTTGSALTASNLINAAEKQGNDSSSGLPVVGAPIQRYVPKKYDHLLSGALDGLSDNQLKAHFALYEGYINKINELEGRIKTFNTNNTDTINYRGWHMEQTSMLNGAVLHELYFGNLRKGEKEPKGVLKKMIDRDFGNIQNFIGHLKLVGKIAYGWSLAALNYRTGKINVYGLERHNLNVPMMVYPVLVLDVYEHAYMIDYGTDRKKYLDVFIANLSWKQVEERLEKALSIPFCNSLT